VKIGIYKWDKRPLSIARYTDEIVAELAAKGVEFVAFNESEPVPESVDLYWDPGTGRPAPHWRLKNVQAPLVVTFHGAANLSLPLRDCYGSSPLRLGTGLLKRWRTRLNWRAFATKRFYAVAVSDYARQEAISCFGLSPDQTRAICHGVATSAFSPNQNRDKRRGRYFLHVSQYQPKKNLDAIIDAYQHLQINEKPRLLIISPGYRAKTLPPCVKLITTAKSSEELADLYRNAIAFVFPSLHETFGMPILEAMASGCPVITSNVTACREVAGDAALTVDPRSVSELSAAMRRICEDRSLRAALRRSGLDRAKQFTWQRSARQHMEVFKQMMLESERK
jgi:glycosyltransferase involved in cell wall biosynthesis